MHRPKTKQVEPLGDTRN